MTPAERAAYERGAREMRDAIAREIDDRAQTHARFASRDGVAAEEWHLALAAEARDCAGIASVAAIPMPAEPEVVEPRVGMTIKRRDQYGWRAPEQVRETDGYAKRPIRLWNENHGANFVSCMSLDTWRRGIRSGRLVILDDGGSK